MPESDLNAQALRNDNDRRVPGGQKIEIATRMREATLATVCDSIHQRNSGVSEDDFEFEVRKHHLPRAWRN